MPSMQTVKCKKCKRPFEARTADINRGWGKFCSKSCKASNQGYKPRKKQKAVNPNRFSLSEMIELKLASHSLNIDFDCDQSSEFLHGDLDDDPSWGSHEH